MINSIFYKTVILFSKIADVLGISYKETNIIVYCFVMPLSWVIMLDLISSSFLFTLSFVFVISVLVIFVNIKEFAFNAYCYLAQFLLNFEKLGISYKMSSIIFCLGIPAIIYLTLTFLLIKR